MGENKLNNEKLNDFVRKAIIGGLYWRMKELSKMGKQIFMLYQVIKKSKVVKEADLKPLEARFEKIDVDMDAMGEKVRETMRKKLRKEGDKDEDDEDDDDDDDDEKEEKGPKGPKEPKEEKEEKGPKGPKEENEKRGTFMKKKTMSAK